MQEHFWQRSKWLVHGALLCIHERSALSTKRTHLVEVVARDPKELAHQCRNFARISVGVRFCHADAAMHGLGLISSRRAQMHAAHAHAEPVHDDARAAAANAAAARAAAAAGPGAGAATRGAEATGEGADQGPVPVMTAVQVAHDFAIARPVLEALQEERLVSPPFGRTLFAEDLPPPANPIAPPQWENDPTAAAYLHPRIQALDPAQREAFNHALGREVALIQGPPGGHDTHVGMQVYVHAWGYTHGLHAMGRTA